jgi:hypothetical protein
MATDPGSAIRDFEDLFYLNRLNRFSGSGGEVLLKNDSGGEPGRMDVGDRLIGIGVTHLIEDLSRPPGPDTFHPTTVESGNSRKIATRSFRVRAKDQTEEGFDFRFDPLTPEEYSATLTEVSEGTVAIPPGSIPEGTIILSFLDDEPGYTLATIERSPGSNWAIATRGVRHWNVGFGAEDDFWAASFPSDEIGLLRTLPPSASIGSIRFGLSLLAQSNPTVKLEPVPCIHPSGETTMHDFCLNGHATGTDGLDTPFPIGLRTAITFKPVR